MTIIQLETFLRIADKGSFSSAASDLGYAHSTVTMQIKQLEEELGADLFNRLGKTISLTPAGDDFPIYSQIFIHKDKRVTGAVEGFLDLVRNLTDSEVKL